MRYVVPLFAAVVALTGALAISAQNRSACRQALQSLTNASSSASFEASRAERDCRDADTSCAADRACRLVPGDDAAGSCKPQRLACESGSRRCRSSEDSLRRSFGSVQSAMSTAQLSCR